MSTTYNVVAIRVLICLPGRHYITTCPHTIHIHSSPSRFNTIILSYVLVLSKHAYHVRMLASDASYWMGVLVVFGAIRIISLAYSLLLLHYLPQYFPHGLIISSQTHTHPTVLGPPPSRSWHLILMLIQ